MKKKTGCPIHDGEETYLSPEGVDMRCEECIEFDRQPGWKEDAFLTIAKRWFTKIAIINALNPSDQSERHKETDDKS